MSAAAYYSFDYGPVHVVVLDQYTNGGNYGSGSPQYTWLVNDLSTSTKPWKIIVLHQPGWSCNGGHPNDTNVQRYYSAAVHTIRSADCTCRPCPLLFASVVVST